MTPVGGGIHTKPHERLPRALILGLMGVLDRAYPWPLWYRDKRTRTSAGLECVIQEQSSFRTQLCPAHFTRVDLSSRLHH
jgi:hypothetical protein